MNINQPSLLLQELHDEIGERIVRDGLVDGSPEYQSYAAIQIRLIRIRNAAHILEQQLAEARVLLESNEQLYRKRLQEITKSIKFIAGKHDQLIAQPDEPKDLELNPDEKTIQPKGKFRVVK